MFPRKFSILIVVFLIGVISVASGCKGGGGDKKKLSKASAESREEYSIATLTELLHEEMEKEIKDKRSHRSPGTAVFNGEKASYFKEYYEYPDGDEFVIVNVQPRDSRTIPYQGTVRIAKIRYATKIHGQKDTARRDDVYQKDSGFETLSFEWRNGDWYRRGGLFVAVESEDLVDGEWVSIATNKPRTENYRDDEAPDLVKKSFLGRMSDRMLFWRK